jgi:hypothetical protein
MVRYENTQDISGWQPTRDDRRQSRGRIVRLLAQEM